MKVKILSTACVILFLGGIISAHSQRRLMTLEAVRKAEEFIIDNGYTDLPPVRDESRIVTEPAEKFLGIETLKMRHNSLERVAYSFYASGENWFVLFRRQKKNMFYRPNSCRALVMDLDGGNAHMLHLDYSCHDDQMRNGVQTIRFSDLLRRYSKYKDKEVRVRAIYHSWFEGSELSETVNDYDGTGLVWVDFPDSVKLRSTPEVVRKLEEINFRPQVDENGKIFGAYYDWQTEMIVKGRIYKSGKRKFGIHGGYEYAFVVTSVEEIGRLKKFDMLTLKYAG